MVSGRVYEYRNAQSTYSHSYVLPKLDAIVTSFAWPNNSRALDFGCGNGSLSNWLAEKGFETTGVDPSTSGVAIATEAYPNIRFSADLSAENLARLGPFELVLCIEVIAHCYDPSMEMQKILRVLKPGGSVILATPYHGYLKNLALAITGRLDQHLNTLWSRGYVHFFSIPTITKLLRENGFEDITVVRVGRVAPLAKSMIVTARKAGRTEVAISG